MSRRLDLPFCAKCGKYAEGGDARCPIYHGRVGDGFCPSFADGETALETCTRFHDWWLKEAKRNDEISRKVRAMPRWIRRLYAL
jgi:hypothetical protein